MLAAAFGDAVGCSRGKAGVLPKRTENTCECQQNFQLSSHGLLSIRLQVPRTGVMCFLAYSNKISPWRRDKSEIMIFNRPKLLLLKVTHAAIENL